MATRLFQPNFPKAHAVLPLVESCIYMIRKELITTVWNKLVQLMYGNIFFSYMSWIAHEVSCSGGAFFFVSLSPQNYWTGRCGASDWVLSSKYNKEDFNMVQIFPFVTPEAFTMSEYQIIFTRQRHYSGGRCSSMKCRRRLVESKFTWGESIRRILIWLWCFLSRWKTYWMWVAVISKWLTSHPPLLPLLSDKQPVRQVSFAELQW